MWNGTCNFNDTTDDSTPPSVNYGAVVLVLIPMLTVCNLYCEAEKKEPIFFRVHLFLILDRNW